MRGEGVPWRLAHSRVMVLTGTLVLLVAALVIWLPEQDRHDSREARSLAPVAPSSWEGSELLVVLVVSSTCRAASDERFIAQYSRIVQSARLRAESAGYSFATLGIALDSRISEGLALLSRFGDFDEVAAGRRWLNSTGTMYFDFGPGAARSVPTILLLRREIRMIKGSSRITDVELLERLTETDQVDSWDAASLLLDPSSI